MATLLQLQTGYRRDERYESVGDGERREGDIHSTCYASTGIVADWGADGTVRRRQDTGGTRSCSVESPGGASDEWPGMWCTQEVAKLFGTAEDT